MERDSGIITDEVIIDGCGVQRRLYLYICFHCGAEFKSVGKLRKYKYCGRQCVYDAKKRTVKLNCQVCDVEILKSPSKLRSKSGFYFCSRKCFNLAQKIDGGLEEIRPKHLDYVKPENLQARALYKIKNDLKINGKLKTEGICDLCGVTNKLVIDHCHAMLSFRGFICSSCNSGLGYFMDDIEKLNLAIKYLERHNNEI